uniref:Mitochondrial ribosomal protein S17 n=2 Tax=Scophthalmus maximus TaxID=52904 RepID=A0A8D3CXQ1_SCOMX
MCCTSSKENLSLCIPLLRKLPHTLNVTPGPQVLSGCTHAVKRTHLLAVTVSTEPGEGLRVGLNSVFQDVGAAGDSPCQMDHRQSDWDQDVQNCQSESTRLVLDPYLLKYYNKRKTYFAHDALRQCTVGDIVLLKALPEARSKHVKHELAEIVYKVGRVVDPLTGKSVAGTEFREPLADLPLSPEGETTITEKLQELNISAAAPSGAESPPAPTSAP